MIARILMASIGTALAVPMAAQEAPRSAIPWLSDVTAGQGPALTGSGSIVEPVTVGPIGGGPAPAIGILSPAQTGLPADFWAGTPGVDAFAFVRDAPYGGPPALRRAFRSLLLTSLEEGADFGPGFLLARIDRLLEIGALDEADALLEAAGPATPQLFRRWFDISLLTNRPDRTCVALEGATALSPSRAVEVFCLALNEDWEAASLALDLGETLGDITPEMADLLAFYLDPGLIEEADPPPASRDMTAFEFYLREAAGLPRNEDRLPIAFRHADLANFIPARYRMLAAEHLAQAGTIALPVLFEAYRQDVPAASGGVWDRSAAVQKLDAATHGGELAEALRRIDAEFDTIGLRHAWAAEFARSLTTLQPADLPPDAAPVVARVLLLAGLTDEAAAWVDIASQDAISTAFAIASTGKLDAVTGAAPAPDMPATTSGAMARALALLKNGMAGDSDDVAEGLLILTALGLDDLARQCAIEMLLDPVASNG